ncbi:unnamed protein product [marine sediment metagenome]|uniref:Dipeptidylpeptidase IV N-terminal domain-containing protein n=1 Tax=marine sediment metagenome TaxID=412755 RepID=X0WEC3_9ZZZZ
MRKAELERQANVHDHARYSVKSYRLYPASDRGETPTLYSHGGGSPRWALKTIDSLCWSPDGKYLAFSADLDRPGEFYIYLMETRGKKAPVALPDTRSVWIQQVRWQPQPSSATAAPGARSESLTGGPPRE